MVIGLLRGQNETDIRDVEAFMLESYLHAQAPFCKVKLLSGRPNNSTVTVIMTQWCPPVVSFSFSLSLVNALTCASRRCLRKRH